MINKEKLISNVSSQFPYAAANNILLSHRHCSAHIDCHRQSKHVQIVVISAALLQHSRMWLSTEIFKQYLCRGINIQRQILGKRMGIDLSLLLELERILKLQSTHIECYKLIIVIQMLIYDNIILLGSINYLNKIISQQKNQSLFYPQ